MPLKQIDPLLIYIQAERFRVADRVLRSSKNTLDISRYTILPSLVNSALASELYMKCIILLETKKPAQGHHLGKLFSEISRDRQRFIEDVWTNDVISRNAKYHERLEAVVGERIPVDLRTILADGGMAFVLFRYPYELSSLPNTGISDLPYALRPAVLHMKPEWSQLGPALSPATPANLGRGA
jgi:HEPN domain-containing protein